MLGQFLPPVIFEVTANATQAIATFGKVNTQLKVMEAQAIKTGKALSGFQKAAVVGTGALKVLGVVAAGVAAIGVKSAMDLEKSYNRLGQALSNMGVASEQTRADLSLLMQSYEDLGFGAEKAADAYSVLITSTGNVERSNRLLALSADLARSKTMDLESASRLIARAAAGNTRVFKEFGITVDNSKDKTVAIEEALSKLEARLGGQASAYAKTFAGQLAVLNEKIGDLFEAIGLKILPVLTKFIEKINGAGKFVKDHNEAIIALAAAITIALIPAVVTLTKKLLVLSATILKSPMGRLAVLIFAVAYAFVKAYNASESFRKGFANVAKAVLSVAGWLVNAFENIVQGIFNIALAAQKAAIALRKLFGKDTTEAEKGLATMEKQYAAIDKWSDGIEKAKKKVDEFSGKKIELKWDFKVPQIPGFGKGDGVGTGVGEGISDEIKKGLDKARQSIKDFNRDAKAQFKELVASWKGIINRDFAGEIEFWLDDSVDELVKRAQLAVNAYAKASEGYAGAMAKLTNAQNAYIAAVKTGEEKTIAAAESALGAAEKGVNGVMDAIGAALGDIKALQDEMIQAVVASKREIAKLQKERTKILEEAQKERAKLEDNYNKTVANIRKKYEEDVSAAQYEASQRRAEIIQTSINLLRDAFRTSTYRTIGDIFDALTFSGRYIKGGTTEKIIKALGLQASKAEKLAEQAAQLAGLGFSQTFIQEVINLGPDVGGELAKTILNSTPESITQLQQYWNRLQTVSNTGVDNLAKQLNSGITLATSELTAQLAAVGTELNTTLGKLQKDLTAALADAFDDYSEALEAINTRTAQQITEIDNQITALTAKIAQLQAAMAALAGLGAPGTSGAGVTLIPAPSGGGISADTAKRLADAKATTEKLKEKTAELRKQIEDRKAKSEAAKPDRDTAPHYLGRGSALDTGKVAGTNLGSRPLGGSDERTLIGKGAGSTTINITANTNASSQQIANDVGWAIRTSSDVQYRTPVGGGAGKYGQVAL